MWFRTGVMVVAILGLASCKGKERPVEFERVELPGFSLEMPAGEAMSGAGQRAQYAAGSIKRGRRQAPFHIVAVNWQPGGLSTPEELAAIGKVIAGALAEKGGTIKVLGSGATTVQGQPGQQITMDIGVGKMEILELTCGGRTIQITAGAPDPGPLVKRMSESLDCRPDPGREEALATPGAPVGFDGVKGWSRMEDPDTFGITDGELIAMFTALPDASHLARAGTGDNALQTIMGELFAGWTPRGAEEHSGHGRSRRVSHGTIQVDGEAIEVSVAMWVCPDAPGVMGIVMNEAGVPRERVVDILLRARCLEPGEKPPTFEIASDAEGEGDGE